MADDARHTEDFRRQGYAKIAGFLPASVTRLVAEECRLLLQMGGFRRNDRQVPGAQVAYAPLPVEALMGLATPAMERIVGRPLWPTYSFVRVYSRGAELLAHQDREACEFSVSVTLATAVPVSWPLNLRRHDGTVQAVDLAPGDALVYRGGLLEHWRDPLDAEWHMQAFMHFVDRDGPFADWKYDRRAGLGRPAVHGAMSED